MLVVDPSVTDEVLSILRGFEEGKEAVLIGKTLDKKYWQGWLTNRNWWCPFN